MQIHEDILFYWIHKRYPNAVHRGAGDNYASGPMFFARREQMAGHLVFIDSGFLEHIVHPYPDTVFLCLGFDPFPHGNAINDCIVLPDENNLSGAFNNILEIFEMMQQWAARLDQGLNEFFS
ncbi:MAG: hypothetical protein IJ072_00180, partial [Oscillospiraceae bacterium]|nr:hypothetical protein [Oscillospiraceae bacterium]